MLGLSDRFEEEAPMFCERRSVGLDVHARWVVAAAIDGRSGEVFRARLTPSHAEVIEWVGKPPGPCAVVYEAGPTGFGLARALSAAGLRCEVAASSKLLRPAGDRVKTDARDALNLALLLRLDEVVPVRIPSTAEEAARDLVRTREAARADLMRTDTGCRNCCCVTGSSTTTARRGPNATTGGCTTSDSTPPPHSPRSRSRPSIQMPAHSYEAVVLATARRARLDEKITALAADSEFSPLTRRLACLRGISTLTGFALAVQIATGTGSPARASTPIWGWSPASIPPGPAGRRERSPRPCRCRDRTRGVSRLVILSHLISVTVEEIMSAYLSDDGAPPSHR
jgi:transposase